MAYMGIETQGDHEARLLSLEAVSAGADARLERIEGLVVRVLDAVEGLSERIGRLEQRIDGLEQRMDGLEKRMDGLEINMASLKFHMVGIEKRLDRVENRHEITDGRLANIEKILGEHSVMHHKHDLNFQTAAVTADFTLREAKGITDRQLALERDLRRYHWIAFGVAASAAGALALGRRH
jgi:chromosome segregation ATPase